jgi:putative (di)nucleoside polyphosphate hydrolase
MISHNQYFRAGAGSVIYDESGHIYVFERSDTPGLWQLQQGGMDQGETTEETLWRELMEETALTKEDFTLVTPYPNWLYYNYSDNLRTKLKDPNCLGQIHRWYYLKLKNGVTIDLSLATHPEFAAVKLSTFPELLATEDGLKGAVYSELYRYFREEL